MYRLLGRRRNTGVSVWHIARSNALILAEGRRSKLARDLPGTGSRTRQLGTFGYAGNMLVCTLKATGYDLKLVMAGYQRTVEDILAEQRSGESE